MELLNGLLGLCAFALWVWSLVIIFRKMGETTVLDKVVMVASLSLAVLFVIGSLS